MLLNFRKSFRRTLSLTLIAGCFLTTGAAAADTSADTAQQALKALPLSSAVTQLVNALSNTAAADTPDPAEKAETAEQPAEENIQSPAAPAAAPVTEVKTPPPAVKKGYTPVYYDKVTYRGKTVTTALRNNSVFAGQFKLSFYCPCKKCCGKSNGITSMGTKAKEGRTIAMNNSKFPTGSKVHIEGYGDFIVEDRGSMKSNVIDVFVGSHNKALNLGIKYANVYRIVD